MADAHSYPRRNAVTRRFTLGAPRDLRVGADGARVALLRSSGPEDPVNGLWVFDVETATERLVVDPTTLGADDGDLPPEERTRRERARESGGGIVAFDTDRDLTIACFALGGQIGRADLVAGTVELLDTMPGGFDPRLAPDGSAIAYVAGDGLRVVDSEGDRSVIHEDGETISWGAAEFIAGEEMGRTRGFWWAPDSQRLLVERVDVAPIDTWWIAAPVTPWEAPRAVRYPAAGTANADVALAIIGLDGERIDVAWDADGWEYLADATWTGDGLLLTVQSRDQRTLAILDVDAISGACTERYRITDEHWVELVPGMPRLYREKLVTVEDRGAARRVCVDGEALTGDDLQVRRVISVTDDGVFVAASADPTTVELVRIRWDGAIDHRFMVDGLQNAVVGGSTMARSVRTMDPATSLTTVHVDDEPIATILDHSETPPGELNVTFHRCGERALSAALVLPTGHDGSTPLPVLLDPYGGPHAQRVQQAAGLFGASQWFADQGFAVIVIDGRGTPGRGPAFEREVRGDLAGPVLDDQIDGLHALAADHRFLDLSRVAIKGWSFGGYLAALAVLRRPDVFHAAVAGAPVTDWRLYDTHYTERYLGNPNDEPANYESSDLCADAAAMGDRALPPLLLIHGLADDNVVAAHTLQFSRALLEAGKPHTVLPLSGVTHMTPQAEVAENLLLVQLAFLREALGIDS